MRRTTRRTITLAICTVLVTGFLAFSGGASQHLQDDQQQDQFQDDQQQDQFQDDQQQDPFQDDQQQDPFQDDQQQDVGQEFPEAQQDEPNVTFEDQTSEGNDVEVARAVLPEGGFVVIREDGDAFGGITDDGITNDTFGNETDDNETSDEEEPLGVSQYLQEGTEENLTIILNESQEGEVTLTATLYQDTNGNLIFDAGEDEPYRIDGEDVSDTAEVDFREDVGAEESPTPTPEGEDEDTPAPGVLVVLTALASLAFWARRRQ